MLRKRFHAAKKGILGRFSLACWISKIDMTQGSDMTQSYHWVKLSTEGCYFCLVGFFLFFGGFLYVWVCVWLFLWGGGVVWFFLYLSSLGDSLSWKSTQNMQPPCSPTLAGGWINQNSGQFCFSRKRNISNDWLFRKHFVDSIVTLNVLLRVW